MSRNEIGLNIAPGLAELRAARRESNGLLLAVFLFSVFYNLLLFTGPLYMMQVYDRVLGSRSEATLLALTLLIVFLFIVMGLLDHARARVMARVGAAFQSRLDRRVFEAACALGLPVKLHADQLSDLGGAALSASFNGLSADHIEYTNDDGVRAMAEHGTVAVLLPGAFHVLRETRLPPVAALRAAHT